MRALGFEDWRQQTVANVEKGKRRITAEEVLALVLALESTIDRILAPIGGDLWVELPSGSREFLPGIEVINLAKGAKGGTGTVRWHENTPVQGIAAPPEVTGAWSAEDVEGGERG